ncbi:MAG: isoprenyl transferase [Heliobacteriaceae bacterium]|jgi:undecaprenyl diphosphate synthase|nr:isoprenyl transferase [Heliobacteriaceae bacterium]
MKTVEKKSVINDIIRETNLQHAAVIMDGNRRWAREHGLPSAMGHKKGAEALKTVLKACHKFGIKYLTVYAFSTENWNRKPEEVDFLMDLLANTIKNELQEMHENQVVINFIGDLTALNRKLREILHNAQEVTKNNTGVNLQIAFNYGARSEIVNACRSIGKKIAAGQLQPEDITEDTVSQNLYTSSIPDPDLLIRTGGEMRISNYLLWQIAYAELVVTKQYWPEFNEQSLADAVYEFYNRQRRFGQ